MRFSVDIQWANREKLILERPFRLAPSLRAAFNRPTVMTATTVMHIMDVRDYFGSWTLTTLMAISSTTVAPGSGWKKKLLQR